MNDSDLSAFAAYIAEVMTLIANERDHDARALFNTDYSEYSRSLTSAASPHLPFFIDLDEYLNSEAAHILKRTSRDYILACYEDEREAGLSGIAA